MKAGILQTGRSPEEMRDAHDDYDNLSKRLLGGRGFEFETYAVLDGKLPARAVPSAQTCCNGLEMPVGGAMPCSWETGARSRPLAARAWRIGNSCRTV